MVVRFLTLCPSHVLTNMSTRSNSCQSVNTVCLLLRRATTLSCICVDYAVAQKERESEGGEEEDCGARRMVWDAEGCVLTVRCCSSGLVYSSYRLKGGRRDVGVTAMETESAHTDNEIQGYITGTACNKDGIRTWNNSQIWTSSGHNIQLF